MTSEPGDGHAWQVLVDCPHCRTEGAVVELFDPAHPATAFGVPVDRRCRLCGWHEQAAPLTAATGGCPGCGAPMDPDTMEASRCPACAFSPAVRRVADPADLARAEPARAALARWAAEEGESDLDVFCRGGFGGEPHEIVAKLVAREPVPTLFDVVAFLFPTGGGGGSAPVHRAVDRRPTSGTSGDAPFEAPAASDRPPVAATLAGRVLASVMVADGVVRQVERRVADLFLAQRGLPPLTPDDLRVWRPSDLGPPPDDALRDAVLEAAVRLMHADGQRDDAEWRVVRTFAAAWGASESRLDAWDRQSERRFGSTSARLGRTLNRWFGG